MKPMVMKTLPPIPDTMQRTLTDEEYLYLRSKYGNALAKGPEDCPTCKGDLTFTNAADHQVYECNCHDQWLLHILFAHAGIKKRYQQYSWQDTQNVDPPVLDTAKTYAANLNDFIARGMGLLFYGENKGTGKTLLASLIAKRALAEGHSTVFVQYPDMIDMWAEGWTDRAYRDLFERRIRHVDLLVIDDIGREHANRSHTADVVLDAVLRDRGSAMLPTIATTNLSIEQLKVRYSENIVSLLTESAMEQHVQGTDFRPHSKDALFREVISGYVRPVTIG